MVCWFANPRNLPKKIDVLRGILPWLLSGSFQVFCYDLHGVKENPAGHHYAMTSSLKQGKQNDETAKGHDTHDSHVEIESDLLVALQSGMYVWFICLSQVFRCVAAWKRCADFVDFIIEEGLICHFRGS